MKTFSILSLLLMMIDLSFAENELLNTHWENFKKQYDKNYESEEESSSRAAWESAMLRSFIHNLDYQSGEKSYQRGMNAYSDMQHDEFKKTMLGLDKDVNCSSASMTYKPPRKVKEIPKSIDWREQGYVGPIKDQKKCGACWAFSATSSLESQMALRYSDKIVLSEQELLDCSANPGCKGGHVCKAFEYATSKGGIERNEKYPYTGKAGQCKAEENVACLCEGYVEIPKGNEIALQLAVAFEGPVSACINGETEAFHHYKSGIFDDPECTEELSHAVTIVGYGADEKTGKEYWIVKNSWGESWGENGYGRVARNKNMCGIANGAMFPIV